MGPRPVTTDRGAYTGEVPQYVDKLYMKEVQRIAAWFRADNETKRYIIMTLISDDVISSSQ